MSNQLSKWTNWSDNWIGIETQINNYQNYSHEYQFRLSDAFSNAFGMETPSNEHVWRLQDSERWHLRTKVKPNFDNTTTAVHIEMSKKSVYWCAVENNAIKYR